MSSASPRTRLVLLRHGETDWNTDRRFQGQADVDLNTRGRQQICEAAEVLAQLHPSAIYTSPLARARETAGALAKLADVEPVFDQRLVEINVGSWSGMLYSEVVALDPGFERDMFNGIDHRHSPEGETGSETGERMGAALREIAERHLGHTVVVVSHGTAIRLGVANLLGWDFGAAVSLSTPSNAAWAVVGLRDGRYRLHAWNRVANPAG